MWLSKETNLFRNIENYKLECACYDESQATQRGKGRQGFLKVK
jgi:hypothetical protein